MVVRIVAAIGAGLSRAALVAAAVVPGVAGAAPALTLSAAVETALRENPAIQAVSSGVDVADARLDESRARLLPAVALSETWVRSNNPVFVFGSLLEQERFGPRSFELDALNDPSSLDNFRTAVEARVAVFDRLQTITGIRGAHIDRSRAEEATERVRQRIRLEVVRTYYGVAVARGRRRVAAEAVAAAEAERARVADLLSEGIGTEADVGAADVQLAGFHQEEIDAGGGVVVAVAALNTVLGQPVGLAHGIADDLPQVSLSLPAAGELVERALEERPDYRQASLTAARRGEELLAAIGGYLPRLDAHASWGRSSRDLAGGSTDYAVGARLTLDLFDAGRPARLRAARAARESAEAERRQKANEVRLEVVRARERWRTAEARTGVAARAATQADETLRIVRDRYETGLVTITELLRAETAQVSARQQLLAARYERLVGYAETLFAAGLLDDVAAFEP